MRAKLPFTRIVRVLAMVLVGCSGAGRMERESVGQEGGPINIAPFGQVMRWNTDGSDQGLMWEDPRDVFRVVVRFAEGSAIPGPDGLRLEYWQSGWPHRRIPRDRPSGSGSSGWLDVGDWHKGRWQAADAALVQQGRMCSWTFSPVNAREFKDLGGFDARYRTTMKLRVAASGKLPQIEAFEVYTDSILRPLDCELEWKRGRSRPSPASIEVFNGLLRQARASRPQVIAASLLYAEPSAYNSFDETVVTVRNGPDTFSFAATDLVRHGRIFIPDLGVLVRKAGDATTYSQAEEQWQQARSAPGNMDLYSRVLTEPEQTLTRAWNDTPPKQPHEIPLSFEGCRQHFGLNERGQVYAIKNWISRLKGRDTPRCRWDGDHITYDLGLPRAWPRSRTLVDGCLPMVISEWDRAGVRYRQTAFVIPLASVPAAGQRLRADDTLVMMVRIEMQRIAGDEAEAELALGVSYGGRSERLTRDGNLIVSEQGRILRMRAVCAESADRYRWEQRDGRVIYRAKLAGEDASRCVDVAIPYVSVDLPEELERLHGLRFDAAFAAVRDYWRQRVAAGTQILTPEPMINDFYKADVSHLLINTEREVGDSDCYMAKVGTFHYGVFSNESCMMISDLDRRGYHDVAERALETFLKYQGTVGLPGDYSTKEGQFYGANGYEAGGYNQHHGWVLWCLGEHYWYTRDKAWLDRAAPKIIKGIQWIINERKRTVEEAKRTPIRAIESGLLPQGSLEDIGDWRSWLSNNVFSWWGMDNAARALLAAGHPEGRRLLAEAEAYRKDLIAAFTEARYRSPVVRLRDGSWVPKVPSEVHRRGRSFGWITETLEGAIYLIRTQAIDPDSLLATWILKDYEDNLYLSEQYGYQLPPEQFERRWFSHGGISQQANLLHNPVPYLLRDQIQHYLRAYFNAFAVSYFPDTRMMTEHALPNIGDWRGDHYKTSDESNSTYWLRLMFVQERADQLLLGVAVPRYWLKDGQKIGISDARTYFGPMSMQMESAVSKGQITMTIEPPVRNPPRLIRARFRHPEGSRMTRVEVNGQSYDRFDPAKEWVELSNCTGRTIVVAYYR